MLSQTRTFRMAFQLSIMPYRYMCASMQRWLCMEEGQYASMQNSHR